MLEIQTFHHSHTGGRRRNEDACAYWVSEAGCCWCVSDGAGGHGGGDIASKLVIDTVLARFAADPQVSAEKVLELLDAAHQAVWQAKQAKGADNMHATCVVLLLDRSRQLAVWAHAGDSRLYHFRGGSLRSQTRDHSLVQSMIDAGYGDPELTRTHPQRSLLTSAIGNTGELTVTVSGELEPVAAGDVFLLCSDGWWELVHELQMEESLARHPGVADWLAEMAALIAQDGGSQHDNYTAIGVSLEAGDLSPTLILPSRQR
jgi:serine/threonine protein phosphatase PrpC